MPKVTIELDEKENNALEEYCRPRDGMPKTTAVKRLVLHGLIRSGDLEPTPIHKDMGLA